jgi:ribosomal subunit interface protein
MNIHIKSTNFTMTPDIEGLIRSKMSSVRKFIQLAADDEVLIEFEVERSTHHKKGDIFHAEANVTHKGDLFRARSNKIDIRAAIEEVRDQVERQITRSRTKRFELVKRGARMIKSMLRKKQ